MKMMAAVLDGDGMGHGVECCAKGDEWWQIFVGSV